MIEATGLQNKKGGILMYKITKNNGHIAYDVKEFVLDTDDDLVDLPLDCGQGSTAFVISSKSMYILNSSREWVKL